MVMCTVGLLVLRLAAAAGESLLTVVGSRGHCRVLVVRRRPRVGASAARARVLSLFHHVVLVAEQLAEVVVQLLEVLDGQRLLLIRRRPGRRANGYQDTAPNIALHFQLTLPPPPSLPPQSDALSLRSCDARHGPRRRRRWCSVGSQFPSLPPDDPN